MSHMLTCYEMGVVPKDEESLVLFLVELARRTVVRNPQLALPVGRQNEEDADIAVGGATCNPGEFLWAGVNEGEGEVLAADVVEHENPGEEGAKGSEAGETSVSSVSAEEGELGESD